MDSNDKDDEVLQLSVDEYEGNVSPSTNCLEPVAYDLQFTFSDQDKELKCLEDKQFIARCKTIFKNLIQKLSDNGYFYRGKFTGGFETKNRAAETCKAHIHLRFYSDKISESMRRTIKRYLTDTYDQNTTGNVALMFKAKVVRDKMEFMRYPLKQGLNIHYCGGYKKEELELMYETAKDSYLKTVQVNQNKLDKLDKSDTLFSRVMELLKKDIAKNSPQYV